ncbi:MAG: proton-conducting transporter membrane subunit [Candidatus Omnitrophica bacterium]|nr:proton-conducting transporter membrane subunit [Candidatus Omnitrophota bacterium]
MFSRSRFCKTVTAYLPASVDKLLGIYLLDRISLGLFAANQAVNMILMILGSITILAAVMMALIQHNMKRLLGYHAVSQVGYMVLGIGTGNPIGIAGGIFHMLNHAVYKSCLFFGAGNVEYRAKTTELNELGGLARSMPFTYISFLVASLSISGVPPFNGFVSKWMIYQGLVNRINDAGHISRVVSILCFVAAMLGSGLTLASFMKLLHAVFLGKGKNRQAREVPWLMLVPGALLALLCIVFGVFAFAVPLKYFVVPVVASYRDLSGMAVPGAWSPKLATLIILLSLVFGLAVFYFSRLRTGLRQDEPFAGGQTSESIGENTVTGADFYNTVRDISWIGGMYKKAENGLFDIYEQGKKVFSLSSALQYLHNGVLPTYMVWMLIGTMILFLMLLV